MKIRMIPGLSQSNEPSGISRVIEKYYQHGPSVGIEFTEGDDYDLKVSHAGITGGDCDVAILHGIYFTGDYQATSAEYKANANIVEALRSAKSITVPTKWVAEIIQRDLHVDPFVVPHGIDWKEWEHDFDNEGYVLYNKNRDGFDVCDSSKIDRLASMCPDVQFVSTFSKSNPSNMIVTGVLPTHVMKETVQKSLVYASLTKETFGIGILEALASGVPVLGWREGGNIDLVEHGLNGYLAEPGDYDDLKTGLFYILNNRKVLSDNAKETAKLWSWHDAVSRLKLALDYALYKKRQRASVSIVIPTYNHADTVCDAIKSAMEQTYPVDEVIVVDDGSSDNTKEAIERLNEDHLDPIRYTHLMYYMKDNGGVALARNFGAEKSDSKYICFLDADDKIDPRFIEVCIDELEKDRSLYIAYSKLRYVNKNGTTGVSGWPDKWDFDLQLQRKNQVPTCCVMRREVIERTGGFRARYAPRGAGSEDADLWTRAGALGMKAKMVTDEALFIYAMGGSTSSKDYHEVDWLGWNGYIKTGQHPIASYASPRKISHNVYQYDNPKVSIIVPVGPGHEKDMIEALDSVEGQTFKKWELIVVLDTDNDVDFSAWPFARVFKTPHPRSGPGVARNIGANKARGGFLVFLDADDWLAPDAIEKMLMGWSGANGIVYSNYYGIATISNTDIEQFRDRVVEYDAAKNRAVLRHAAGKYDCVRAQKQPTENMKDLYHWCIVTCLVPKAWHDEIGGYDENMESWEDVDYHWRMARAGKCYTYVIDHLVYYRFDTGNRRQIANPETNRQTSVKLLQYMYQKYERIPVMSCKTCGGSRQVISQPVNVPVNQNMNSDTNYEMVIYNHPNRGDHMVVGPATGINYGYRGGGDKFLAHRKDIQLMPNLFVVRPIAESEAPKPQKTPVSDPKPIEPPKPKKFQIETVPGLNTGMANELKKLGISTKEDFIKLTEKDIESIDGMTPVRIRVIMAYIERIKNGEVDG